MTMYCGECGKQNPEGAKFCAFCGNKLPAVGAAEPAAEAAKPAPETAKPDPHQAFKRPSGDDVRPMADNPAQPARSGDAKPAQPPRPAVQPAKPAPQPAVRKPQGAITASGGEVMPPSRAPNVKKASGYSQITHRTPVVSPYAQTKKKSDEDDEDLFFEAVDEPYDDEGEDNLVRHLKSAIAVLFLVLVVGTLGWLFLSHSGQMFRAEMGLPAPAEIYRELGDQRATRNELKGAADAYYRALSQDSSNYIYAMLVGQAYEAIGDYETAFKAYQLCQAQRENAPEPYLHLAEIQERNGNAEAGRRWRQMGYEKTGDASLLKEDPRAGSEDILDPVPAMPAG